MKSFYSGAWIGLFLLLLICCGVYDSHAQPFGVNWGHISRQPLPPGIVVRLLQDNNITRVKLFDADYDVLRALSGSGIEVMVAVPNEMLESLASSQQAAKDWVRENVSRFLLPGGPDIQFVAVGNEPFLIAYNGSYQNYTLPALQNIQQALSDAGHAGRVYATIPFNADVLCPSDVCPYPSQGVFRPDIYDLVLSILNALNDTGAPFCLNIYPFLSLALSSNFPEQYAFFGTYTLTDITGAVYHNVFDATYDTLVAALKQAGFPDMHITVGEIGWPTDGNEYASIANAQQFTNQVMQHLASNPGTPLRPNAAFDVYLFGLLDENLKSIDPGGFERHWGIFYGDGNPKYQLDFTGGGNQNSFPTPAVGVQYLPQLWCIVDPNVIMNATILAQNVDYACQRTDCTSIGDGGSCSLLSDVIKASYAFNNYFQFNYQDQQACNFENLATVTSTDPSISQCRFEIGLNYQPFPTSGSRSRGASKLTVTASLVLLICSVVVFA